MPVPLAGTLPASKFSRQASVGLFVGVRDFPHDERLTVPYAVDDAVDLAHRFSLDQRVGLIPPRRVVLAISGQPQKEESKERLQELKEAGARIVNVATTGDILNLLKDQAALAGDEGLLVLSIASHGFQQHGDAYILGSTSEFGSNETSLRTVTLFETAAKAPRSLVFIDACRDRTGQDSRGGTPDVDSTAPHIDRMGRYQGQVIFYGAAPGQYAFDDDVHQNGVFTKAVLDGLNCEASAPRGTVLVSTLHSFVDRQVRRWIKDNKGRSVNPATYVSMEGETRNMPLSQCWRTPASRLRAAVDGTIVTAYGDDTRPLWRRDFGEPVVHAEAADLDADAFYEVVVGLPSRVVVLDRDKKERWRKSGEGMTLATFTTGDLYEKRTNQIVALWNDPGASSSRLTVFDSGGNERSKVDHPGLLRHVAIGRPTNMHAPRIVVATDDSVSVVHAKKLDPYWTKRFRSSGETIEKLRILDTNHDSRLDLTVDTTTGTTWFTFDGKILRQSGKMVWEDVAGSTRGPKRRVSNARPAQRDTSGSDDRTQCECELRPFDMRGRILAAIEVAGPITAIDARSLAHVVVAHDGPTDGVSPPACHAGGRVRARRSRQSKALTSPHFGAFLLPHGKKRRGAVLIETLHSEQRDGDGGVGAWWLGAFSRGGAAAMAGRRAAAIWWVRTSTAQVPRRRHETTSAGSNCL
ncbi:MAG TPA: caspase family protein [Thermoanaerobaculia bacterium]|nr:caspase family protein [Thermoanaerobaculia bacterium]